MSASTEHDSEAQVLIRLQGVSKVFYTDELKTRAVAGVDLEVRQGEFISIEGPSGSGKTTLLSILGLLDDFSEGTYRLGSQPVSELAPSQRARLRNQRIGFVFQSFNLIGDLTVYENVELPLTFRDLSAGERKQRVESALARVDMSHRMSHFPSQLSGGQQQRVAVARAVVGDPLILLADEPTGNLDSKNGDAVMELLSQLHQAGTTICMVTHNPEYARYATRTITMFDGKIVEGQAAGSSVALG